MTPLHQRLSAALRRLLRGIGLVPQPPNPIARFELAPDEIAKYFKRPLSELEALFLEHEGRPVHKWTHFLPIYDELLCRFKGSPVRLLEIGVSQGGSLEIWRKYFGASASIAGIDIDRACRERVETPNRIFIGSQADKSFLEDVVHQFGRPSVVIDDGSHVAAHQRISFEVLFPVLEEGGIYIIEDTHTAYWPDIFDGGYRRSGTAIEFAKAMVDDIHAWYHLERFAPQIRDEVRCIRFYDSLIAIEKRRKLPPRHYVSPPSRTS